MKLSSIQEYAMYLSKKEGWDKETTDTRIAYLQSEINEAIAEVNKLSHPTTQQEIQQTKQNLGHELFDIIWNVAELANRFNIDLEVASEQKMHINGNRSFSKKPPLAMVKQG